MADGTTFDAPKSNVRPPVTTSAEELDPVITLWRAWWLADCAANEVAVRYEAAFYALEEGDRYARVRFGSRYCVAIEEIEAEAKTQSENAYGWSPVRSPDGTMTGQITASPKVLQRIEEKKEAALNKLADEKRRVHAVQDVAGVLALEAELNAADERAGELFKVLGAAIDDTPSSAMASLHVAVRLGMMPDDLLRRSIDVTIRALAPGMPADLIEAMQRDLTDRDGQKSGEA